MKLAVSVAAGLAMALSTLTAAGDRLVDPCSPLANILLLSTSLRTPQTAPCRVHQKTKRRQPRLIYVFFEGTGSFWIGQEGGGSRRLDK